MPSLRKAITELLNNEASELRQLALSILASLPGGERAAEVVQPIIRMDIADLEEKVHLLGHLLIELRTPHDVREAVSGLLYGDRVEWHFDPHELEERLKRLKEGREK